MKKFLLLTIVFTFVACSYSYAADGMTMGFHEGWLRKGKA